MQLPEHFISRITTQLGDQTEQLLNAIALPAPVSIRLNPFKPINRKLGDSAVAWCELGRYINERPVFTLDPFFHAGAYYVQEASSMFLEQVLLAHLDKSKTRLALDLCAAPGGKSTHLRSLLSEHTLLVSNEVVPQRNLVLCDNMIKWGHPGVVVTRNDPADFTRLPDMFDLIVVDAPCSGEGMFRKDQVAVSAWSLENVQHCAVRQRDILDAAVKALAPGGLLVYSTCTWSVQEDEEIVDYLIKEKHLSPLQIPAFDGVQLGDSSARFYPHLIKGEGFFIAALRKSEEAEMDVPLKQGKEKYKEQHKSSIPTSIYNSLLEGDFHYHLSETDVWAIPGQHRMYWQLVMQKLRVVYSGVKLGVVKGNDLIPSHAAAMNIQLGDQQEKVELSHEDALRFLRGDALPIDRSFSGWLLLTYENVALGWGKAVQGRLNNHYPKELRIRMNIDQ